MPKKRTSSNISFLLCLILPTLSFAQQAQPSLWCGPSNNYSCTEEQKIAEQRRQMQQRENQSAQRHQGQQDITRYWELLQRQRDLMERKALQPN